MTLTNRSRRQKVLGSLAVIGVLGAVIVAVAVTSGGEHRRSQGTGAVHTGRTGHFGGRGDLPVAAGYLGLSTVQLRGKLRTQTLGEVAAATSGRSAEGLIGAILAARQATLSAAVAAGELTRAEAGERLATIRRGVAGKVNRAGGYGIGAGGVGGIPGLTAAARYLGLTPERLRKDLRSRRTLAQVANATGGRSAAGLIATLVAERRAVFDTAVAAGGLTRARESKLLAGLSQRITAEVNRVPRVAGATG